ncbi:hypothetical protein [Paenibacillus arenosi]|uniref:Uncharacterized protein n=1 Tax=Paenibacillus arenosi TaxID=2774142 RepID=A0ABR9B3Y1_9BACL|nr:hypothetical protein [Paenibacillus arenosi]MBD8501055.1 hypothetical protein [Paenibacillus arenosi]
MRHSLQQLAIQYSQALTAGGLLKEQTNQLVDVDPIAVQSKREQPNHRR